MKKIERCGVRVGSLLLVVSALIAVTALYGTTSAFASSRSLPLRITTTSLPNGTVCASYSAFITANKGGGSSLDTWKIVSGALPAGLTMAQSYGIQSTIVFGTPTTAQSAAFTVQVQDSTGETATRSFGITINQTLPLAITSPAPPPATVGSSYFANLFASGGCQPYTWSITAGQLPPGLMLVKGSNGGTTINGTPTTKGTYPFTETVTDSADTQASQQFSITVN